MMKVKRGKFSYYIPEYILCDDKATEIYSNAIQIAEDNYNELFSYYLQKFRNNGDSLSIAVTNAQSLAEQILPIAIREVDRRD